LSLQFEFEYMADEYMARRALKPVLYYADQIRIAYHKSQK